MLVGILCREKFHFLLWKLWNFIYSNFNQFFLWNISATICNFLEYRVFKGSRFFFFFSSFLYRDFVEFERVYPSSESYRTLWIFTEKPAKKSKQPPCAARTIPFFAFCYNRAFAFCLQRYLCKLINLSRNDVRCYLHFIRTTFASTICKDQQTANILPLFKRPVFFQNLQTVFLLLIRTFKRYVLSIEYPDNCYSIRRISDHFRCSYVSRFHGVFFIGKTIFLSIRLRRL